MAENREFKDGELIGGTRYQVVRLVGVGGMGTVYEVEHIELGKRFVVKVLLRELSRRQDLVQRLRNEWRALGRLNHPNIVTVTDAGTTASGVPFYVMERLHGETLSQRLRRLRRLPVREAIEIAIATFNGLSAAHRIGVVHRDIKPPNIFLVQGGVPTLLDFGVAKIADDPSVVTARGVTVGTPRYMSPEQARGEPVDARADLYATGLLLFEMVAGIGPFDDAKDANELLLAHMVKPAPLLSSVAMGVPPALDAEVKRLLDKARGRRPASAEAAAAALAKVLGELSTAQRLEPAPLAPALPAAVGSALERVDDTTRPEGTVARAASRSSVSAPALAQTVTSVEIAEPSGLDGTHPSLRAMVTSVTSDTVSDSLTRSRSTLRGMGTEDTELAPQVSTRTEMLPAEAPPAKTTHTRIAPLRAPHSETPPPVVPAPAPLPNRAVASSSSLRRRLPALAVTLVFVVVGSGLGWALTRPGTGSAPEPAAEAPARFAPPAPTPTIEAAIPAPTEPAAPLLPKSAVPALESARPRVTTRRERPAAPGPSTPAIPRVASAELRDALTPRSQRGTSQQKAVRPDLAPASSSAPSVRVLPRSGL